MEKRASVDVRVKVVHKAKETTKLVILNQAAADILAQFRRLVVDCFPDLVSEGGSIQLEYKDTEGDHLLIEDDSALRSAIAESISSGQVPKFIASSVEVKAPGAAISVHGRHSREPVSESSVSWVADKMNRFKLKGKVEEDVPAQSKTYSRSNVPCRHFQVGVCRFGAGCKFLHAGQSAAADSGAQTAPTRGAARNVPIGQGIQRFADLKPPRKSNGDLPDVSSMSLNDLHYWLQQQIQRPASMNIELLSSEDSHDHKIFVSILERRNLSERIVDKLVELLTKEEIRRSMMRHKTNRIYGLLMGSLFVGQLQSQIQGLLNPTPGKVHSYVRLVEELQSRTSDGWKEVPLDAIKRVVDDMIQECSTNALRDTTMNDLLEDVKRLLEQRDKSKRLRAVSTANQSCQAAEEFLRLPILPSKAEMVISNVVSRPLPVNQIGRRYSSVIEYLETHFQLLREDYIEPFRQGINGYKKRSFEQGANRGFSPADYDQEELQIYVDVRFQPGFRFGREGIEHEVEFKLPGGRRIDWERSKRLMFGSLLCFSEDEFLTFFWALVVGRDERDLAKGRVNVRLITEAAMRGRTSVNSEEGSLEDETTCFKWFERSQRFVMVESASAYFEAYVHVLKSLQREDMCRQLVFTKHLIDLEPKVGPPSYLARRPELGEFKFGTVFPELLSEIGRDSFDILTSWPDWKNSVLDDSQMKAFKQGLTKEVSVIQGPPGTGKTFVGLLLVKALLANVKTQKSDLSEVISPDDSRSWIPSQCISNPQDVSGPILVVCYTNHALDQFLLGIYKFEKSLIRIGGRSKDKDLMSQSLSKLVKDQRGRKGLDRSHHRALKAARDGSTEFERIIQDMYLPLTDLILVNRRALSEVATPEQVDSLLMWRNPAYPEQVLRDEDIVQIWLAGSENMFIGKSKRGRSTRGTGQGENVDLPTILSENKFDTIQNFNDEDDEATLAINDPYDARSIDSDLEYEGQQETEQESESTFRDENGATLRYLEEVDEDSTQSENDEYEDAVLEQLDEETLLDNLFTNVSDIWTLPIAHRLQLHDHWLLAIKRNAREQIESLCKEYEDACKQNMEIEDEIRLALLTQAKVVGMTTTAGARHHDLLVSLKQTIVIVEEAAEVLESHILACLSPSTKHLILIGDHQQLRPSVSVHKLAVENKLDISLFERLVTSGVEFRSLEVQRRMRPAISQLIQCLYPNLKDHPAVSQYPDVVGVRNNVFFLDHKAEESSSRDSGTGSKVNTDEARIVVEFCLYLLNQGCYSPTDITILSMYSGQVQEIKSLLYRRLEARWAARIVAAKPDESADSGDPEDPEEKSAPSENFVRVSSVDDFQGEESNIILLSLVRSNRLDTSHGPGKIGFLNIQNRVCVAISRARYGLYLFGNAELLAAKSALWKKVIGTLAQSEFVGSHLTLYCQNHPGKETRVAQAIDFKQVEDGGCSRPCGFQLPCGHVCPQRCHPGNHDLVACVKACAKRYETCEHSCTKMCHAGSHCPPCVIQISRVLPECGHEQWVCCSERLDKVLCKRQCTKTLACGHPCPNSCGQPCVRSCFKYMRTTLSCGHPRDHFCFQDPASLVCYNPCKGILDGCNHECQGTCGECKQGTDHVPCKKPCQRLLLCGHSCQGPCSEMCPPCQRPCEKKCVHSTCSLKCGEPCVPCMEKCAWRCRHYQCELFCHETCTRPRCNRRCNRYLKGCRHRCSGICGEPCPKLCKICHGDTVDAISLLTFEELEKTDKLMQLQDCKHAFEVTGLDSWMAQGDTTSAFDPSMQASSGTAIQLKQCPLCRTPVRLSYRYSNVVKTVLHKIEAVKRLVNGYEHCKLGNEALTRGDVCRAIDLYQQALKHNPGLVEAHLAIGCAFAANKTTYVRASYHFQYLADRSSFKRHPATSRAAKASIRETKEDTEYYRSMFQLRSSSSAATTDTDAVKAMVQWASLLTKMNEFDRATQLCDAVLEQDPGHDQAHIVKKAACAGQIRAVVAAVSTHLPGPGRWYQCPNGHIYVVGECGGPMQMSQCPDCNAVIGGERHTPAAGNVHSRVDGSTGPAWGDGTGLGNFQM